MKLDSLTSILIVAASLVGCHGGSGKHVPRPPPVVGVQPTPSGAVSVADFGAKGDGIHDDRAAIQAAIDATAANGQTLYLPPGTYLVSGSGSAWGLDVPAGVHFLGAGQRETVMMLAPEVDPNVRLMRVTGADVRIEDLTLDGNSAHQSPNEQRHGVFATKTSGLQITRVTAQHFTGDGFYLHNGVSDTRFVAVRAIDNDRNGITLGGTVDNTFVVASALVGNGAQQLDSEPGRGTIVSNTTVTGSLLDGAGVSNDYALTCSGWPSDPGHGWHVVGNVINGGTFVVGTTDVVFTGNTGVNPTTKSSITVYQASARVKITSNHFRMTQQRVRSLAGVLIQGTGTNAAPADVLVASNDIEVAYEQSFGVRAEGAISIEVVDNKLRGPGRVANLYAGVYVRATNPGQDFRSAIVRGNTITNFGDRGVSVVGNGAAKLLSVEISDNIFTDDSREPTMTTGISLDDGTGAAQRVLVRRNQYVGGVRANVINFPARAVRQ